MSAVLTKGVEKKPKKIKIFTVYHKQLPIINVDPFVPIQVGGAPDIKGIKYRDNKGDSIAHKNANFCELTAHYWIWKNVKADYVGLCHYRRIPSFSGKWGTDFKDFSKGTCDYFGWNRETIEGLLADHNVLMSPCWDVFPPGEPGNLMTPYEFHAYEHRESDIAEVLQVIKDKTPEFVPYAQKALCKDTRQCFANICVMRKDLFDHYSKWLFTVLFELERRITLPESAEQARVFGFLSERLIMVWLAYAREHLEVRPWFANALPVGDFGESIRDEKVMVRPREKVENPILSVVVPVYNVERYLHKCLNSVCNQSEERIEIICINDGSTDSSLQILKDFAAVDKRIRIIDQKNAGLGAARNRGIDEAVGKYIAFVDSDDWVDRYIWMRTIQKAEKFDLQMVLFDPIDVNDETGARYQTDWECTNFPQECYKGAFTWRDIGRDPFATCVYAHNRILRRDFVGNRRFPTGVLYEDNAFHFEMLFTAERIGAFQCGFYFYRIRSNSLMGRRDKRVLDHLKAIETLHKTLQMHGVFEEYEADFLEYVAHLLTVTYKMLPTEETFDAIVKWLKNDEYAHWNWQKSTPRAQTVSTLVLLEHRRAFHAWVEESVERSFSNEDKNFLDLGNKVPLKSVVKYLVPYGIMRGWLALRYDWVIDEPLFAKKITFLRLLKFTLPYGIGRLMK